MEFLTAYWSYILGALIVLAVLILLFVVIRSTDDAGARIGSSLFPLAPA